MESSCGLPGGVGCDGDRGRSESLTTTARVNSRRRQLLPMFGLVGATRSYGPLTGLGAQGLTVILSADLSDLVRGLRALDLANGRRELDFAVERSSG